MIDKRASFLMPESEPYVSIAMRGFRKEIRRIFSKLDFSIETGVEPSADPLTFGLFELPKQNDLNNQASLRSGIARPRQFSVPEMLLVQRPVVAKLLEKHRGRAKYLVETPEQKIQLAAFSMLGQGPAYPSVIETLIDDVRVDGIKEEQVNHKFKDGWVIEEFIDTPGEHFTSLRIVTDGLGIVHYGKINVSAVKKADDVRQVSSTTLLEDPDSPLFLNSRMIQSNLGGSGRSILLDGKPKTQAEERQILVDLSIDPDRPFIPDELIQAVTKTASLLKNYFPYWGWDFLQVAPGSFVMSEVQIPGLDKAALGMQQSDKYPELSLCERIGEEILRRHALRLE